MMLQNVGEPCRCFVCKGTGIETKRKIIGLLQEVTIKDTCSLCNGIGNVQFVQNQPLFFDLIANDSEIESEKAYQAMEYGMRITDRQAKGLAEGRKEHQ